MLTEPHIYHIPDAGRNGRCLEPFEAEVRQLLEQVRILTGNILQVKARIHVPGLIDENSPLIIFFDDTLNVEEAEATIAFFDLKEHKSIFCGIPYLRANKKPFGDITLHTAVQLVRNLLVRIQHPQSTLLPFNGDWDDSAGEGPTQPAISNT